MTTPTNDATPPSAAPTDTGAANPAGNTAPTSNQLPAGNSTPPAPSFTQADVDKIVSDRIIREHKKFADYDALKERAKQWEKFEKESKPEQERALDAAREEGQKSARAEFGAKLALAHITAAAAGRMAEAQVKALLENVDPGRFLDDKGDVDNARVTAFIDGIAPPAATHTAIPGGFGQGQRAGEVKPSLASGAAEWERRNNKSATPPLIT